MSAPTLKREEYQFLDDGIGIKLNSDVALPFVDITSVDGLDGTPSQLQTINQPGRDGGWVDSEFEGVRTVAIEGIVYADPLTIEDYLDLLKANYAPSKDNQPLYFGISDDDFAVPRMVLGKSSGLRYVKDAGRRIGQIPIQIQVTCEDPRIYTANLFSTTIVTGHTGFLSLSGNRSSGATIVLNGPLTNPVVSWTDPDGGGTSTLSYNDVIASGDTITIDLINKTVLDDAGDSQRGLLVPQWFLMQPGTNNFSLSSSAGTGNMYISCYEAWR